jgi:hypothetical protein
MIVIERKISGRMSAHQEATGADAALTVRRKRRKIGVYNSSTGGFIADSVFTFIPEILFEFIPEQRSESSRNRVHVPPDSPLGYRYLSDRF